MAYDCGHARDAHVPAYGRARRHAQARAHGYDCAHGPPNGCVHEHAYDPNTTIE